MKKYIKYIILAIWFFIALRFIYIVFRMDTYNNFGFSYAIAKGQIPYKDFYLIVPLFSPFLYSVLLYFNHSIIVFYLEQIFLLLIFSYLLFKILDKKAWIVLFLLLCPFTLCFPFCLFPGYNFLILFELVLLLYLNHYKKNDMVIGFVAGLALLTKQNIGIFIMLVTIIYPFFKNKRSSLIRFIFSLIPIIIFVIYLLITNTFLNFIDLCFLGMKSFTNNLFIGPIWLMFFVLSLIIIIRQFIKSKDKNISYYYVMSYLPVVYPIFNDYHIGFFILFLIIVYLYNKPFELSDKTVIVLNILIVVASVAYYFVSYEFFNRFQIVNYNNMPLEFITKKNKKDYDYIIQHMKKHSNTSYIIDPSNVVALTVIQEAKLDHYFVLFRGNFGKNGEDKIYQEFVDTHDRYFVVQKGECNNQKSNQFICKIPEEIEKKCDIAKELNNYIIYYKK